MMDVVFVENEIKKDIEECLKYYGFKNTSSCEHKVYVSKLDNLIGWEICVSFFNLGTSSRHNVKFMFFGIPVDSDTTLFKMVPLKSSLSTEQMETDFWIWLLQILIEKCQACIFVIIHLQSLLIFSIS